MCPRRPGQSSRTPTLPPHPQSIHRSLLLTPLTPNQESLFSRHVSKLSNIAFLFLSSNYKAECTSTDTRLPRYRPTSTTSICCLRTTCRLRRSTWAQRPRGESDDRRAAKHVAENRPVDRQRVTSEPSTGDKWKVYNNLQFRHFVFIRLGLYDCFYARVTDCTISTTAGCIFTAWCYAERGYATVSLSRLSVRLSVCNVQFNFR